MSKTTKPANRLLAALPAEEYARLLPQMREVPLKFADIIHETEARLARWLLMTGDRMERDEFPITHEFLSNMLGVRCKAVSRTAANLQQNGLISYSRGHINILDRANLEAAACRCYLIFKEKYKMVLG